MRNYFVKCLTVAGIDPALEWPEGVILTPTPNALRHLVIILTDKSFFTHPSLLQRVVFGDLTILIQ